MTGLILKDLLNLKRYVKSFGLIIILYTVIFINQSNTSFLVGFITIIGTMMVVTTFGYDELAKWDRYALTMPLRRKDIVLAKYLLGLILGAVGAVVSLLICLGVGYFKHRVDFAETLYAISLVLAIAILFLSVILPLIYKFGAEKARILMIASFLIPVLIVVAVNSFLKSHGMAAGLMSFLNQYQEIIPYAVAGFTLLALVVSCAASLVIFEKKDL